MSDRRKTTGRRTGFERRRTRDSQRNGGTNTVVIEITGSDLRIARSKEGPDQEKQSIEAFTVQWRNHSPQLCSEDGRREFTEALRAVVQEHATQNSHFHFVLGGDLCVTKAVRGSSEHVRNEIRELEERSRLYLSLGPGEKAMVENTQPIDARHDYAVVAVCNRETLNLIYDAATEVGIDVTSIEPALVSVCRVIQRLPDVPEEPCLLMHADADSVEVGVYHEGRLLLDYRPGGRNGLEEVGSVVQTHLSRLKRHTAHQLRSAPPELTTIYLCGDATSVSRAIESFRPYEQFEVRTIKPAAIRATWDIGEEVKDPVVIPALGMMLGAYQPKDNRDAPDFMKHIIASTQEPIRPVLIRSLIPIAATLLIGALGFGWNLMDRSSLSTLQQQLDGLQQAELQSRELRLRLTSAEQKTKQLRRLISGVGEKHMKQMVAHVGHCMPSDVWLTELNIVDMDKIVLSGSSILEDGIFDFINYLGKVPEFSDVAPRSTSPGSSPAGPVVDFSIEVNLSGNDGPAKKVARHE